MDNKEIKEKITSLLAEQLGVDSEDIHVTDSLKDDLHLSATDISDFMERLEQNGFDTSILDMSEIDTFEELLESIGTKELI